MKIKFTDNSDAFLNDLKRKQQQLDSPNNLYQILTDDFVKENTNFSSYEEMMNQILTVSSNLESTSELDEFISSNSKFSGFQEMVVFAALNLPT